MVPAEIVLQVNGRAWALAVDGATPLLTVLRNDCGLNGPKYGCGLGECGACSVLLDGTLARSLRSTVSSGVAPATASAQARPLT